MTERALKCPQCSAPIVPGPFARLTECPHCGSTIALDEEVVERARFRRALEEWCDPERQGAVDWVSVGGVGWTQLRRIGEGERCEVFSAVRARWPSERVVLKVLVEPGKSGELEREWENLVELRKPLGSLLAFRLPDPVVRGPLEGAGIGPAEALVLRDPPGRFASAAAVGAANPSGIPARPAIWLWRRVLESLAGLHREGWCHGAMSPDHVLVEAGEHGARLIGFECAGERGAELPGWANAARDCVRAAGRPPSHDPAVDVAMSASVVEGLLGAETRTAPEGLLQLLRQARRFDLGPSRSLAWGVRESLGALAREVYGAAAFYPLNVPATDDRRKER